MSKYTSQRYWLLRDGKEIEVFHSQKHATEIAKLFNDETAALRQQIADLQAENAKLKADCASYDTELNRVAVAFLDATEKLQQVEAKESPTLKPLGDSSIVWNMAYAEKTEASVTPLSEKETINLTGKVYALYPIVTAQNELMVTFDLVFDDGSSCKIAVFPKSWAEHKNVIETGLEVEIVAIPLSHIENKGIRPDVEYIFKSLVSPASEKCEIVS